MPSSSIPFFRMYSDDDFIEFDSSEAEMEEPEEDQILNITSLKSAMQSTVSDVLEVLEINEGVARILLQKYNWSKDVLMDKFYESADRNSFLTEANVIPKTVPVVNTQEECEICCDTETQLDGLACGHQACVNCWKLYLAERIGDGQSEIECLDSSCNLLIEDEKTRHFLKNDQKLLERFDQVIINNCIQSNPLLKWCPGVDCGRSVKSTNVDPHLVLCDCGTRFCFSCGQNDHEIIPCRLLKLWLKKAFDDSETTTWKDANTKDCPKCGVPIEKNGGCNYIRCTNKTCKHQFCWICMNPWSVHANAWYNCSAFVPSEASQREADARAAAQAKIERYLHYFHRYMGHMQSLEFEQKLRNLVSIKMEQIQECTSKSWNDVRFLQKAIDILSTCRRTLMYTYIFAFYLQEGNNRELFESNQKDLEMTTETLTGFLENELEDQDVTTLMTDVQDKCRYLQQRRQILLEYCIEGLDNNTWVFTE
ncbi:unnamed protein product [Caenorhabditis brenneri]